MELVSNRTGLNITDVRSIWSVYDTLFCEVRGDTQNRPTISLL